MTQIESLNKKNVRAFRPTFVFLFGFFALIAIDQWIKYLAFHGSFGAFLENFRPLLGKDLFYNAAFY